MLRYLLPLLLVAFPAFAQMAPWQPLTLAPVVSAPTGCTGPGDIVAFAAWWGVRGYSAAACASGTAKMMNVVRVSDSHACDVLVASTGDIGNTTSCGTGGDNGQTVASFLTATTGLATLYDQVNGTACGGSNCNTSASSTAPQLLLSGCGSSHPCLSGNGIALGLATSLSITQAQPYAFSMVANRTGNFTSYGEIIRVGSDALVRFANSADSVEFYAGSLVTIAATDNVLHAFNLTFNGASSRVNVDGSFTTQSLGAAALGSVAYLLNAPGNTEYMTGLFMEAGVVLGSVSDPNLTALCHQQRLWWGSTGSC